MSTWVELLWNDLAKLCSWKIWNSLTSRWISFFTGDFSDSPKPKEIYTWFFCRCPSKYSVNLLRFSSFTRGLFEVVERLSEGAFKLWESVSHGVNSVSISGKMVLPLCHLPWWNGSFVRGEWWRKSVLSQPTCNQFLIIRETGKRNTEGENSGFSWFGDTVHFSLLIPPSSLPPAPALLWDQVACFKILLYSPIHPSCPPAVSLALGFLHLSTIDILGQIIFWWGRRTVLCIVKYLASTF